MQKFVSLEQRFSTFKAKVTNNELKIQGLELEQKILQQQMMICKNRSIRN